MQQADADMDAVWRAGLVALLLAACSNAPAPTAEPCPSVTPNPPLLHPAASTTAGAASSPKPAPSVQPATAKEETAKEESFSPEEQATFKLMENKSHLVWSPVYRTEPSGARMMVFSHEARKQLHAYVYYEARVRFTAYSMLEVDVEYSFGEAFTGSRVYRFFGDDVWTYDQSFGTGGEGLEIAKNGKPVATSSRELENCRRPLMFQDPPCYLDAGHRGDR